MKPLFLPFKKSLLHLNTSTALSSQLKGAHAYTHTHTTTHRHTHVLNGTKSLVMYCSTFSLLFALSHTSSGMGCTGGGAVYLSWAAVATTAAATCPGP